jgi:soluble lytic murein transglycosylase
MQLMPDTAAWIAKQLDDQDFSLERLHEPDMNIRYGTWYLSSLRDEFQGNEVLMLAAYNAGRGNVHEWMDTYGWTMDFSAVDEIPYEETKAYVASVLKNKKKYEALYGKNGS